MLGGLFVFVYHFRRPQGSRAAGCFSHVSLLEYLVPFRLRAHSCMDLRELVGYIICVVFDKQALAELKAMRLDMQELRSDNTRLRSDHKRLASDNARLQDRVKRLEARVGAGAGSPASTFRPLDAADAASFCHAPSSAKERSASAPAAARLHPLDSSSAVSRGQRVLWNVGIG